jgi:phosphoribosyl 1,2-cyclic phosphate phosphodiesterase
MVDSGSAAWSPALTVTFLGCGTSTGVPMIGCDCAVCLSPNPRNKRMRPSILVTVEGRAKGEGNLLVDTTPEMRLQMLREGIGRIEAVFVTHNHADHILGMDDIRQFNFRNAMAMPIYSDRPTLDHLRMVFDYAFRETPTAGGKPRLELRELRSEEAVTAVGVSVTPLRVFHGRLPIFGYKFGSRFAYVTDVSRIPDEILAQLRGLDTLVLGAVRHETHPTHFSVGQAVEMIADLAPRRAFLTHLSHHIEYEADNAALPPSVRIAYDGLRLAIPAQTAATGT